VLRVLAGDLTATFNLDGQHLHRYVQNRASIAETLCEQLILHDQVFIPTNDYLTAAGLIEILGEKNFIELIESNQLRFIRLRQVFGYVRGTGRDGSLIVFGDPESSRPQDSPLEASIKAGLSNVRAALSDRPKLERILAESTACMESSRIIDDIREKTYSDLRKSSFWNDGYSYHRTNGLKLPGLEKNSVRVIGPGTDVMNNAVDALLSLAQANLELYLARQFECTSTSSASPIGDSLLLEQSRAGSASRVRSTDELWSFLKIENVPNVAALSAVEPEKFLELIKLTRSRHAGSFRAWFAQSPNLSEKEMTARYIELLHDVPWFNKDLIKGVRFLITTAVGKLAEAKCIPLVGEAMGAADVYGFDRLRPPSPKYFVDDLKKFTGRIAPKERRR
jgi:hypothetical protein